MNKIFIFDTNYLYETKDLRLLFKSKQDDEEFFVTDIVIDEIKFQNDRKLKKMYEQHEDMVQTTLNQKYFGLKNNIDIESVYEKSSMEIQKYFKRFFKENVIYGYSKEEMYDELMERVRFKKAPFFDAENSSDKGFKDTLIWMSVLKFIGAREEKEFEFITNDKGFLKQRSKNLQIEFTNLFPDKKLKFVTKNDFNKRFKQEEVKGDSSSPIVNDSSKSESVVLDNQNIKEYREMVDNFFYYLEEADNPFEEAYVANVFTLSKRSNFDEVVDFLDLIKLKLLNYVFHKEIDFTEVLVDLGYGYVFQNNPITKNDYEKLVETYTTVREVYPAYFDGFIKYIMDSFCSVKVEVKGIDDDLPF